MMSLRLLLPSFVFLYAEFGRISQKANECKSFLNSPVNYLYRDEEHILPPHTFT